MRTNELRRGVWLAVAVAVVGCLTGAIQVRKFIGALRTSDGWYLAEQNDQLVLVAGTGEVAPKLKGVEAVWQISAPHMQTPVGKYLEIDETESGVRLSLSAKKTIATRWKFDIVSSKPANSGSQSGRRLLTGTSSRTFRLRLFDGDHEGWYLAAEPRKDESDAKSKPSESIRDWRITEDPKQAVLFEYVDSHYSVGGR